MTTVVGPRERGSGPERPETLADRLRQRPGNEGDLKHRGVPGDQEPSRSPRGFLFHSVAD
jgi:hypothetical protein